VVAVRRLREVARAPSPGLEQALAKLRKTPQAERGPAAMALTSEQTWEGDLARLVVGSEDEREKVDAVSEAVGDLAASYGAMSRWTVASVRIVLFVGLILVAVGLAQQEHLGAVAAFACALGGAIVTHSIGSAASRRETRQRELADGWVELLVDRMPERKRRG
jgi:hypothetical protein